MFDIFFSLLFSGSFASILTGVYSFQIRRQTLQTRQVRSKTKVHTPLPREILFADDAVPAAHSSGTPARISDSQSVRRRQPHSTKMPAISHPSKSGTITWKWLTSLQTWCRLSDRAHQLTLKLICGLERQPAPSLFSPN